MHYTITDWPVKPMEPVPKEHPFDSEDTIFQVKWDGVRVLTYVYPDKVRLVNRRLNERTTQYPEMVSALSHLQSGTVLDGEIIALGQDGKPSFPKVLQRDLVRSPAKISVLVKTVPVHYMVFDVLWHNGQAATMLPLTQRQEILEDIKFNSQLIHMVQSVRGQGKALFQAVQAEDLEGIVAKKADSPYLIGQKSNAWQKIKYFRTIIATVGGYLQEEPSRIRSLLVGLLQEEGLRYIGAAASGITQKQWHTLKELLEGIPAPCPFVNPPALPGVHWVKPIVKIQVRFLEYTSDGTMRAPAVIGFLGGLI